MPHWSKIRESWPLLTNPRPARPEVVPRSGSIGTTRHRGSVGTDRRTSSGSVSSAKRVVRAPSVGSRAGSGQAKSGVVRGVSGVYWEQLVTESGERALLREEEIMRRKQKVLFVLFILFVYVHVLFLFMFCFCS